MTGRKITTSDWTDRDRSGYYTIDGVKCISATTVLSKAIPKPALIHWSAIEVAKAAIDAAPRLARMRGQVQRDEMFQYLRNAAETKKDTAANLGTEVHAHAEAIALGKPMPEASDEAKPFLLAYENFARDWLYNTEATELRVAHPEHGWAGTLDLIVRLNDNTDLVTLADFKTGKGVYPDYALQLAAYRNATVGKLKDGTRLDMAKEFGRIDRAVVVHLRPDKYPDTGYRVIPLETGPDIYDTFLTALAMTQQWTDAKQKTLVGEPLTLNAEQDAA